MKTALVAGASGLIGRYLLNELLDSGNYQQVKALLRKPVKKVHPVFQQVPFDYAKPDASLVDAEVVFCCLGTTLKKAGSKDAFRKVDFQYPLDLAKMAFENGCKRFAIVTAIGSDKNSRFFYSRVKGELEQELQKIPFESLHVYRPSMLLGPRSEFRVGEEIGKTFMKVAGFLFPKNYRAVHASQVANAMVSDDMHPEKGIHFVESGEMLKFSIKKSI